MNIIPAKKIKSRPQNWISLIKFVENRSKQKVRLPYCNLYAYAANNPVHYIDPDGRKLYICGTKEYMAAVQQELQQLCSDVIINFDTGEVFLSSQSTTIFSNGYELLSFLINSSKTNIIWLGNSKMINPEDDSVYGNSCCNYNNIVFLKNDVMYGNKANGPQNSIINFDPENCVGGVDDKGSDSRPPYVGVAHECGHSEDFNKGLIYPIPSIQIPGTTPDCERNAIDRENQIREEHGLVKRTWYNQPIN